MDNFSLLQIIERFSELRFKYMGSYPSDIVPQLSKYTLAIINSDPSNDRGEHWIMIPQQKKITTLVILWVDRYQFTAFWQKSIDEWFLESYKKQITCLEFTQPNLKFFILNSSSRCACFEIYQ